MSSTTVAEFASELKKSNETLLEQLKAAGVAKSTATDTLTDSDKQNLLSYLQASHGNAGGERKKITLVKKSTTEIKQADSSGKARTIQVEVRKKRTFVRREDGADLPVDAAETTESAQEMEAASALETAELARREEEASRQAELIRRQEEELAERRRQREEQEAKNAEAAAQAAKQAAEAEAADEAAKKLAEKAKAAIAVASPDSVSEPEAQSDSETSVTDVIAAKAEAAVKAKVAAAEKSAAESIARAEEAERAADLGDRRRKAEAEAAAIRLMMSSPAKKAPPVKKPEELRAEAAKAAGLKGTLHKPVTVAKPGAPVNGATAAPGGAGKEVKSAKLSSSWAGDPAKKKGIPTRAPGRVENEEAAVVTITSGCPRHLLRHASLRSTFQRPSPCLSWRTRWLSKLLKSSNT
jgi:translation initiation factor IF-2